MSGCKEQDNNNSNGNIEIPDDNDKGPIFDKYWTKESHDWIYKVDGKEYSIGDNITIDFKCNLYSFFSSNNDGYFENYIGFCVAIKENEKLIYKNIYEKDEIGDILFESDELYPISKYRNNQYIYINVYHFEKYFTCDNSCVQINIFFKKFSNGDFVYQKVSNKNDNVYYKIENDKIILSKKRLL